MENYQGDLADIVRASGGPNMGSGGDGFSGELPLPLPDWRFPADPMNYMEEQPVDDFGDPFSSCLRDPLLHELDIPSSGFFNNSTEMMKTSGVEDTSRTTASFGGGRGRGGGGGGGIILEREMKRPPNIFTRMLQISPNAKMPAVSPCDSPVGLINKGSSSPLVNPNHDLISVNNSKSCLVENTGVQISSPRNTGIKRRKSQAKKVVCIPAPAPANNRPSTGEVVPSDLWAWRKYGQKPIKGSPYPRGYYRCSSSKGCSARKQVERSRTDPNMLVITYTSEHNHPWPTQRNALAGSTRSQPSKTNSSASSKNNSNTNSPAPHNSQKGITTTTTTTSLKEEEEDEEEEEEEHKDHHHHGNIAGSNGPLMVKEEMMEGFEPKEIEMEDGDGDGNGGGEYGELGFPQNSYRPLLPPESTQCDHDFFAELGELEADPLNLLFTQAFSGDHEDRENHHDNNKNKASSLDPFVGTFDWIDNNNNSNNNNNTSLGEAKKGFISRP